jgi:DNA-binding MarR family transcriptional regulator
VTDDPCPAFRLDGRAQTLSLTRAGRSIVPKLAALADANDAEFFDHLAPKDRAALLSLLRYLRSRSPKRSHAHLYQQRTPP